jgi:hypothetical protein
LGEDVGNHAMRISSFGAGVSICLSLGLGVSEKVSKGKGPEERRCLEGAYPIKIKSVYQ